MAATNHDTAGSPYRVPPEPKRWPSIGLAVGVHALLLAFLYIGVNWQTNSPVTVEAEVWDMQVQSAAPPPPPPAPEPEPEPEPVTPPPEPTPRAVEPPPPPPPVAKPEPVAKPAPKTPDIALEQKKRKEELKRKQAAEEERERELAEERAEQKRADDKKAKALADKQERLREEKERKLAEQKEREAIEKKEQLAKQEQAKKDDAKKKADKEKADKLAKEKAEKAKEAEQLAKLAKMSRDAETKRITGSGNPGSTGSAEKSTAPRLDAGYQGAIAAKIKSNANYAGNTDVPGNPTVSFKVEQLPTGEVVSVKMTKSSGIPEFDDAVERSINKSSPLPKKKDGTVERSLSVNFHMKDLN